MATAKPQRLRSWGLRPLIGPSSISSPICVPGLRPVAGLERPGVKVLHHAAAGESDTDVSHRERRV